MYSFSKHSPIQRLSLITIIKRSNVRTKKRHGKTGMNFLRRRRLDDDAGDDADYPEVSAVEKLRKPPNTAFRQQRLKAWQPILTPKTVIPFLFLLAVIFAPLGIAMLYTSYNVHDIIVDYSHCDTEASDTYQEIPKKYASYHLTLGDKPKTEWKVEQVDGEWGTHPVCTIKYELSQDLKGPLFLYYKLTNFYQNHRKYVELFDIDQLKGKPVAHDDITDKCKPLRYHKQDDNEKIIYPCGLIANLLFNDTIGNPVLLNPANGEVNQTYEFSQDDISWKSDRNTRFGKTEYKPEDVVPPPNWAVRYPDGYTEENMPNLQEWQHLQNWMRTSGLPSFYKLYGKNHDDVMSLGIYEMKIDMYYPVSLFGGTKLVVISTSSTFGGRNMLLGVIYIIVAVICVVLAVVFLLQHLIKPRAIGDHEFLLNDHQFRNQL